MGHLEGSGPQEEVFGIRAFGGDMEVDQQVNLGVGDREFDLHLQRGLSRTRELLLPPREDPEGRARAGVRSHSCQLASCLLRYSPSGPHEEDLCFRSHHPTPTDWMSCFCRSAASARKGLDKGTGVPLRALLHTPRCCVRRTTPCPVLSLLGLALGDPQ